jgi:hypothetical protein
MERCTQAVHQVGSTLANGARAFCDKHVIRPTICLTIKNIFGTVAADDSVRKYLSRLLT